MNWPKILEQLCHIRFAGSDNEKKAAEFLASVASGIGFSPTIEKFSLLSFEPGKGTLKPTEPDSEPIDVKPVGLSANADIEAPLIVYSVHNIDWVNTFELEGKIVLTSLFPFYKNLKAFYEAKCSAVVCVVPDEQENSISKLSQRSAYEFPDLPCATISFPFAMELIKKNVKRAMLQTNHQKFEAESQNVIFSLPGETEKTIMITAHYDSTPCSPGAQDNAAGTIGLLMLAESLAGKKFKRGITFALCGSEEFGLLGSKFYTAFHSDQLDSIDLVINLDVGGDPFGYLRATVLGNEKLANFVESISKTGGIPLEVKQDIYSSDGMPFARFNIPSISFSRTSVASKGHSPYDSLDRIHVSAIEELARIVKITVETIASACVLPFPRQISDELMKNVREYFEVRGG